MIGADPEVFLIDTKGKHLSSIGRIGGDKWNPLQCKGLRKGFTLQEDNVALEFGIPPATTAEEFSAHIELVMKQGLKKTGLKFSTLSAVVFAADQMKSPEAHVFGCEPDYNAWTGEENRKPMPPNEYMRSAGGHIHIATKRDPREVGKYADLFLGIPSVLMDDGEERRKMYGKAGAIRFKPYGVEYRTLSNFWIFDDRLRQWAFRNAVRAESSVGNLAIGNLQEAVEEAINYGNKNVARELVKEFQLEVI